RISDFKSPRRDSPECREMSPASESLTEIMCYRSDVGSLGAGDAEMSDGFMIVSEAKPIHMNEAGFALDLFAFAGAFVKWHTLDFDGAHHWRDLIEVTKERFSLPV